MKPKKFKNIFLIAASFFYFSLFPMDAKAEELQLKEDILNQIEKQYSGNDFCANFHQISHLKAIDITETASGQAFFSHPGKMRWEYHTPEKNQIITDGSTLWIYRPDENQVVKGNALAFFKRGAGGAFLSDISLIRDSYTITIKKNNDITVELILAPKIEDPEISSINIRVVKKSYKIDRVITFNIYGDTTELQFSDISFKKLEASLFKFTVPDGVDLLFMNSNDQNTHR